MTSVGANVTSVKAGDVVGVGCLRGSCQTCKACQVGAGGARSEMSRPPPFLRVQHDEEQFCKSRTWVYNSRSADGSINFGGYAQKMVVDKEFVLLMSGSAMLIVGASASRHAPPQSAGLAQQSGWRRAAPVRRHHVVLADLSLQRQAGHAHGRGWSGVRRRPTLARSSR